MELISSIIYLILNLDQYLYLALDSLGIWTNILLFMVIFLETGLVVTPFLPGDSLIFAVGAFAAKGYFNLTISFILLVAAAILGDSVNYWIGKRIGIKAFKKNYRFLNKTHLARAQSYYKKHGGKTIILARFVPIVRTFAPFVAGVGTMDYPKFAKYNVLGALLWVSLFLFGGYFFGNIDSVQENFELVILGIAVLSVTPVVYEFVKSKRNKL